MYKFLVLFAFALLQTTFCQSQTVVSYSYDDSGNRTYRGTIVLESSLKKGVIDTLEIQKEEKTFEDKIGEQKITIYPNPTKGVIKVEIENFNPDSKSIISLYSLKGNLLQSQNVDNPQITFDLTSYPMGTYILKIKLGDKKSDWKILKE